MKHTGRLFLAVVCSAGLLVACGGEGEGGGLSEAPLPTPVVPTVISPEELAKRSAESAGYALRALAVEDPAQPTATYQPQPDTRLVAVQVEFENVSSDDAMAIDVSNAIVTDDQGIDYSAVPGAREGEIAAGEIGKGEKASGWISFAVPKDARLKTITYRIGLISTIALTADLPVK